MHFVSIIVQTRDIAILCRYDITTLHCCGLYHESAQRKMEQPLSPAFLANLSIFSPPRTWCDRYKR